MILSWEFEFVDDFGNNHSTRTSQGFAGGGDLPHRYAHPDQQIGYLGIPT